jgi:Rieske Fe-S protein
MGAQRRQTVGRRQVIAAAAGLAAGGAVAGCSGSPAVTPPPPSEPPTSPPTDAQVGSAAAHPTAAGSAGTALGPASDVPVGGGTVFESLEVVVTQPVAGRFVGLTAVCTHTGCIVDKVADGLIECPCHGSRYRLDGTVARGPAPRALPARPVTVVDGSIMLS